MCRTLTVKVLSNLTVCSEFVVDVMAMEISSVFHYHSYLACKATLRFPTYLGIPRGLAVTGYMSLNKDNQL